MRFLETLVEVRDHGALRARDPGRQPKKNAPETGNGPIANILGKTLLLLISHSMAMVIEARAAISAYFVLLGMFVVMALFYTIAMLIHPGKDIYIVVAILYTVCLIVYLWLRGFRILITTNHFEYRDGLYRTYSVPICDIVTLKDTWVEYKYLTRTVSMPRWVIIHGRQKEHIIINIKPFKLRDLQNMKRVLKEAGIKVE